MFGIVIGIVIANTFGGEDLHEKGGPSQPELL